VLAFVVGGGGAAAVIALWPLPDSQAGATVRTFVLTACVIVSIFGLGARAVGPGVC
jgi:hypothetical protein